MIDEKWFTVAEIAERLKVEDQTVRRWLKSGELIGTNFGGRTGWRVREEYINAFLKRREALAKVGPVRTDLPQNVEDVQWHHPTDDPLADDPKAAA